jgi:hypothetical protein
VLLAGVANVLQILPTVVLYGAHGAVVRRGRHGGARWRTVVTRRLRVWYCVGCSILTITVASGATYWRETVRPV